MSRRISARGALLATTVGALLAGSFLGAPAAMADQPAPPTVTIVSPTGSDPVSGTVTFTVSVDQPDTAHPVTEVYLEIYGGDRSHQAQDITVAAGQCAPTCTISADFDTKTLVVPTNPDTVQYLPDLPDGTAEFAATVYTSFGPTAFASANVDIENHRPILQLPDLPVASDGSLPAWTGIGTISTRVATELSPAGGASITSFRLMVPYSPVIPLADLTIRAPADGSGTGTITADTSQVAPGSYIGYLVAVDSDGVASALVPVYIVVPDPYSISVRVESATADGATITVIPKWKDRSTAAETWLADVSVYDNGVLLRSEGSFPAPHDAATVTVPGPDGGPFPAGDNTLTVTTVDNRGIQRSVIQNMTTIDPLTVTWSQAATVVEGAPSGIGVGVADASKSVLQGIVLAIDGKRAAAISNASPTLAVTVPATFKMVPGRHDVTATVLLTNGQQYVFHRTVAAYGHVAVALSAPAATAWGSTSAFRASLTMDGKAQSGALLELQSRRPNSSAWMTQASARTNTAGATTFHVAASLTGTASWRVVAPAGGYRLSGASPSRTVWVAAQFGRLPTAATIHRYQSKRFTLSVAPRRRGVLTTVQYRARGHSVWHTLTHASVSETGQIRFTATFAKARTYRLRVVWPPTVSVVRTASGSWTLRVVKQCSGARICIAAAPMDGGAAAGRWHVGGSFRRSKT